MSGRVYRALALIPECLFVAAANLFQHKLRLVVAVAGTTVPVLLLVLQIAFLAGVRTQVTRLFDFFSFDIAILPQTYQFLGAGGTFDRVRLVQATAVPGVVETFSLNIDSARWIDDETLKSSTVLNIGVDDQPRFFREPGLYEKVAVLANNRSVLVDEFATPDFGRTAIGTTGQLDGQSADIRGHFQLGLFFYADASVIVPNVDFARYARRDARSTSIGLVRLAPGYDRDTAKARLLRILPADVRVLTHGELIEQERAYFISTKPLGVMLGISVIIAFLAGAVILMQVLSTEISNRTEEFATMKAMGFAPEFIFGVGMFETLLLAVAALLPGFGLGGAVLGFVQATTHVPTALTGGVAWTVTFIVLCMCAGSVFVVWRRISRADPAELF